MRCRTAAVAVVGIALGVGGCGEAARLSDAQFTRRADAVCRQMRAEFVKAAVREKKPGMSPEQLASLGLSLMPRFVNQAVAGLAELTPPSDKQDDFDAYRQAMHDYGAIQSKVRAARGLRSIAEVYRLKDQPGNAISAAYDQQGVVTRQIRRLGLRLRIRDCA